MTDTPKPAANEAARKGRNQLISGAMLIFVVLVFSICFALVWMADTVHRGHELHMRPMSKPSTEVANASVSGAGIS